MVRTKVDTKNSKSNQIHLLVMEPLPNYNSVFVEFKRPNFDKPPLAAVTS